MTGQKHHADGGLPPHSSPGEADPALLALLGRLAATEPADETGARRLPPAVVNRLLAVLVEQNLPAGFVVTTQDELERLRERAYADGWQDAQRYAAHQAPLRAEPVPAATTATTSTTTAPSAAAPSLPATGPGDGTPGDPGHDTEATVLAFPPRIPLVRAAEAGARTELMPHRPRRRRRVPPGTVPPQQSLRRRSAERTPVDPAADRADRTDRTGRSDNSGRSGRSDTDRPPSPASDPDDPLPPWN